MQPLHQLREEYSLLKLNENEVDANPINQFQIWMQQALESKIKDANAMALSTVDVEYKPSSRIVLLKEIDAEGFVFFTNYLSQKGMDIHQNPNGSLLFYWKELERQVRIEGVISKISEAASDEYFYSRPIESQIGAINSNQSAQIASRSELEEKIRIFKESHQAIVRPKSWGGYKLTPSNFEFWQGRLNRLHDRICYQLENNNQWKIFRRSP